MTMRRGIARLALVLTGVAASAGLGTASAAATELSEYRWEQRPLLIFAPTDSDPRVVETLGRIETSRCEFVDRDMVLGLIAAEGTSTLDGHVVDTGESRRLADEYAIGADDFTVLVIGKDGGEKLRINEVPDLQTVYAVIDGMPMRSREAAADPDGC